MESIFIKLLNMSISASWLVMAVVLLRFLLKNAPKWTRCVMWGLVAFRLICPFSLESMFSLIPSAEVIPQDIIYAKNPEINTGMQTWNDMINASISVSSTPVPGASLNPMQAIMILASNIWVLGMMVMLIYSAFTYFRIRGNVTISMRHSDNIYYCDSIDTPFILGILRPRIYIPSGMLENRDVEYVIAHERAHLKRRDHWWKPFGFTLLTVYWFNPILWIAYILLCRDIEMACDEYVIRNYGEFDKKSYSNALLSCSISRKMIAGCPLAFGEVGVKSRIKEVLYYKKPAFWVLVVSIVTCVVFAVCFLTNPKEELLHAPEPFCHTYRVEEVIYDDFRYNFSYTEESAPRYSFTADYIMYVSGDILDNVEGNEWVQQRGDFEEINLRSNNFDEYFKYAEENMLSEKGIINIRKNTKSAWRINVENNSNGLFYYFILTDNGDVYLTYGYDTDKERLIRQMFKLTRTDIKNIVAEAALSDQYKLVLQMIDGTVTEDTEPGPFMGINRTGNFALSVVDTVKNETISTYEISDWTEPLRFVGDVELNVTDYNEDGSKELLLGQHGGSNYNIYHMYYITKDFEIGYVSEIGELVISSKEVSPVLEVKNNMLIYQVYDMNSGSFITKEIALSNSQAEDSITVLDMKEFFIDENNITSIVVTNGWTGEEKSFSALDSSNGFQNILEGYYALDVQPNDEDKLNQRIGYQYCMRLYDGNGELLQTVTPYKDCVNIDGIMYDSKGNQTTTQLMLLLSEAVDGSSNDL